MTAHQGHQGNFRGIVETKDSCHEITYGAVIVATGGRAYEPQEYLYAEDRRVLSQVDLSRRLKEDPQWVRGLKRVVMIQCVGSRNEEFSFCSRDRPRCSDRDPLS